MHGAFDLPRYPGNHMPTQSALAAPAKPASAAIRWSVISLVAASWVSAASFGLYIIAFYLGSIPAGRLENWNRNLPGLYARGLPAASAGIAAHFAAGAVILLIGPLQLIGGLRSRFPWLHRWLGRVYVFAGGLAGLGGFTFIIVRGTVGGAVMNLGFGLYGVLTTVAAVETYRHGRARRLEKHRAWGIRLFALAIGSWLYRMDYGFWLIAAHSLGHTGDFRGPFDMVMAFFFYVPNLILVEMLLRSSHFLDRRAWRLTMLFVLNGAALFITVGTYYFLRSYWGPAILRGFPG
jgi:hypothetical protein